jgi:hypothetical protein
LYRCPVTPEPFGQPVRLDPVRRVEVVPVGKHLQVEVREEHPGQPGCSLYVFIRLAQSAEGEEHRLAEGGQP